MLNLFLCYFSCFLINLVPDFPCFLDFPWRSTRIIIDIMQCDFNLLCGMFKLHHAQAAIVIM